MDTLLCVFRVAVLKRSQFAALLLLALSFPSPSSAQTQLFDYTRNLFGAPSTLSVFVVSVNPLSGLTQLNGGDSHTPPASSFTWKWGDGATNSGFFPQSHTYANVARNYVVSVIANYTGGLKDTVEVLVRFVPASYEPDSLPSGVPLTIPSVMPTLGTRLYSLPPNLSTFDNSFFITTPRTTLERILTQVAGIERDFTNDDIYLFQSQFAQVMLRDASFGGAYALWFTDPVAFGVGDVFMQGTIGYSALFHEMGHNFTLNTPANFYYGGRIDGPANAIYSEAMAQIYQHATGWVLLNSTTLRDVDADLALEIKNSVTSSMNFVRNKYDWYVNSGKPFTSWQSVPSEAGLATFVTIAYKFCEHAETSGMGYRAPVKRMLHLLQLFDQDLMDAYDRNHNTADADSARATLMVAAVSYGFMTDLRAEFEALNFPIDDVLYDALVSEAGVINTVPVLKRLIANDSLTGCFDEYLFNLADSVVFDDPDGDILTYSATSSRPGVAAAAMVGTSVRVTRVSGGVAKITVTAADGNGGAESTAFIVTVDADCDNDGIAEDGDGSGIDGDSPCTAGSTINCDDNCFGVSNPSQLDSDGDGIGDACDCICAPCHADPQCDGTISDVLDVVATVAVAFRGTAAVTDPGCPRERTDFNCDGVTSVLDVVAVVGVAFRGSNPATTYCDPCA